MTSPVEAADLERARIERDLHDGAQQRLIALRSRHPIEIESAVYFTCVEALQNAVKHADGATAVSIELRQTSANLHFEVRDDGPGFTLEDHAGRGLRNMHDRIEAIGGEITVQAKPGRGTRVVGSVPLP